MNGSQPQCNKLTECEKPLNAPAGSAMRSSTQRSLPPLLALGPKTIISSYPESLETRDRHINQVLDYEEVRGALGRCTKHTPS